MLKGQCIGLQLVLGCALVDAPSQRPSSLTLCWLLLRSQTASCISPMQPPKARGPSTEGAGDLSLPASEPQPDSGRPMGPALPGRLLTFHQQHHPYSQHLQLPKACGQGPGLCHVASPGPALLWLLKNRPLPFKGPVDTRGPMGGIILDLGLLLAAPPPAVSSGPEQKERPPLHRAAFVSQPRRGIRTRLPAEQLSRIRSLA